MIVAADNSEMKRVGFCKLLGESIEHYAQKYEINIGRKSKATDLDVVIGEKPIFFFWADPSPLTGRLHPLTAFLAFLRQAAFLHCMSADSCMAAKLPLHVALHNYHIIVGAGDTNISRQHACIAYNFGKGEARCTFLSVAARSM